LVRKQPELARRLWDGVEQVRESRAYRQRERVATLGEQH
jgi:hypothetical protein